MAAFTQACTYTRAHKQACTRTHTHTPSGNLSNAKPVSEMFFSAVVGIIKLKAEGQKSEFVRDAGKKEVTPRCYDKTGQVR